MGVLQSVESLEEFYEKPDPWDYENNQDDISRRALLLSVLPKNLYEKVLDIGCGDGFVTSQLPGKEILGIDISANAIQHATKKKLPNTQYVQCSLFDLPRAGLKSPYDLIIITGVLYPQYIGASEALVYTIIDDLLQSEGHLVCCHIEEWYRGRFPYMTLHREYYPYREYTHVLEVYLK